MAFVHRIGKLTFPLFKVIRDARFETHGLFPVLDDGFNENVVKNNLAI